MTHQMESTPGWSPVVIIGAPRSGTNMLRDILTRLPCVETWPCDEINYIWRHGNRNYPSDEFSPEHSSLRIQDFIRRQFRWVAQRYNAHTVVEKTCANSLRVGFVDKVVPEARYIFIRRDGLDAVGSAVKRWTARPEISYLAKKARFVPVSDLPFYGRRYLWNQAFRLWSGERRLASWGPRIDDMKQLQSKYSLEEVVAMQWTKCVNAALDSFSTMPADRWTEVVYEDFVRHPRKKLLLLVSFLGLSLDDTLCREAVGDVTPISIGKGTAALGESTVQRLKPIMQDTMFRLGYG